MDNAPSKKPGKENENEDFFALSSSPFRKGGQIPKNEQKPEAVAVGDKSAVKNTEPLRAVPKEVEGPPVLDLSKNKFPKPKSILVPKEAEARPPKMKSDPLGGGKPFSSNANKIPAGNINKKPIPMVDVSAPPQRKISIPVEKTAPDRPDKYKEPIEDTGSPASRDAGTDFSRDSSYLKEGLSEVEKRIKQIETVMPSAQTVKESPPQEKPTDVIDEKTTASSDEIEGAIKEIEGYVEMIGGVEDNGKLLMPEDIGNISRRLLNNEEGASIEEIPQESGVRDLVVEFSKDIKIRLK
ncbi:MAG: hypothetical protein QF858_01290 [Candidatus Pacebacteria bacterium]|jgi:hypothetical protein|nr:hypothetical protein [bacterium]MDP6527498.1 hypothetical protein [Candidatus Paceibacterota bacterium]MDP6659860.1 hypothetical protein [Candidatus Paceibacterota bacterium]|tara:strand:- start:7068 stop:7955 length:888 start_codon:yes stop_codon:yes gene_type:complete